MGHAAIVQAKSNPQQSHCKLSGVDDARAPRPEGPAVNSPDRLVGDEWPKSKLSPEGAAPLRHHVSPFQGSMILLTDANPLADARGY